MDYGKISKLGASNSAEDFLLFDGTDWVAKGGTEKIKLITSSRNLATATSTVSYTGVGFKPSYIRVIGNVNNGTIVSHGSTDKTNYMTIFKVGTVWQRSISSGADCIQAISSVGNGVAGNIDSFDADGFTITWTRTGSPTGTFNFGAECFR